MANVTLPVPGGIVGHGRTYNAVVLREPTFREYMEIGDVYELMIYPSGMRIPTLNSATLTRYIEACLVEPKDPIIIEQGGLKLAKAIRGAVLSFFQDEPSPTGEPSPTSPQTSSSGASPDGSAPAM